MAYSRIQVTLVGGHQTAGNPSQTVQRYDGGEAALETLEAGDYICLGGTATGQVETVIKLDMDGSGIVMSTTQLSPVE